MNRSALIVSMGLLMFALRSGGLLLGTLVLPVRLQRALQAAPVAVFGALVVSGVTGHAGETPIRLIAVLVAALALLWRRQIWIGVVAGMAAIWLLRWIGMGR